MRRVFVLVAAIVLVDTAFYAALVPVLPHYVDELGLSQTQAGILTASYAAGTLVGSLPGGICASRFGVKPTVLSGLGLLAVTSVIFGFGESTAVLVTARFAQGVGGAFSWAGGLSWLIGKAPAERRGEMIGSAIAAAIFGVMLGPVLGAAAVELGTEWVFSAVGVVAVGLAAWAIRVPSVPSSGRGIGALLRSRERALWVGVWLVALPAIFAGTINVLIPLKLDELGASAVGIGAIFLGVAVVEGVITPIIGRFSDRRGRMLPLRAALVSATAVGVALAFIDTLVLVALGTLAVITVLALFWAPAMAMLSEASEAVGLDHGLAGALINLAWSGGQVIGGGLGGPFAEATTDAAAYAVIVIACLTTLAVILASAYRPAPSAR